MKLWLLKSLNFKIIEIYDCGVGDFNRSNRLTPEHYEMPVIAEK